MDITNVFITDTSDIFTNNNYGSSLCFPFAGIRSNNFVNCANTTICMIVIWNNIRLIFVVCVNLFFMECNLQNNAFVTLWNTRHLDCILCNSNVEENKSLLLISLRIGRIVVLFFLIISHMIMLRLSNICLSS